MKQQVSLFLMAVIGVIAFAGCKPPAEDGASKTDQPDLFEEGGLNAGTSQDGRAKPVAIDPPQTPAVDIGRKNEAPVEPNWNALKTELVEKHKSSFTPLAGGDEIVLTMRDGSKKPGKLEKVEGNMVHVEMAAGSVGYPATALHPSSQVALFELAHAQYETVKELRAMKADYEKEKAEWERKQQELLAARSRPKGAGGSGGDGGVGGQPNFFSTPATIPENDPSRKGAVIEVVDYLRDYVRNPESVRFLEWGKVQKTDNGWRVALKYSFSTETMKNAVTHKWFLMDKNGKVYRTALYKDPSSLPKL